MELYLHNSLLEVTTDEHSQTSNPMAVCIIKFLGNIFGARVDCEN